MCGEKSRSPHPLPGEVPPSAHTSYRCELSDPCGKQARALVTTGRHSCTYSLVGGLSMEPQSPAPPSSPTHARASMAPLPWPCGQLGSTSKISFADGHHRGQLPLHCPLQGLESDPWRALPSCGWPLDLSGAHRLWLSLRDVPAPPSPSSRLQLPGEAGQFPLVVDDLQLLDISPSARWTPGAQGLLRACGDPRRLTVLVDVGNSASER